MQVINKNIKKFEEGKKYIFVKEKIDCSYRKWVNFLINNTVEVKLEGLGFVKANIKGKVRNYTILPHWCWEIK